MRAPTRRFRRSGAPCSASPATVDGTRRPLPSPDAFSLARHLTRVAHVDPIPICGRVVRVVGLLIESLGPRARVGEICEITGASGPALPVQVVGFRDGTVLSVPLGDTS